MLPLEQRDLAAAASARKVDQANRFCIAPTAGAGDSRAGDRDIGIRAAQRTFDHRLGNFLAHRTGPVEQVFRDPELQLLRFIGVGNETAIDDVRGTGNFG